MIRLFNKNRVITLKKYAQIKPEEKELIDYTLKNSLKSNHILRIGRKELKPKQLDFWKLSWNDIILIRHYIDKKDMQAVHKLIYGITEKQFVNLDVFNCAACYKWTVEQIKNINEIESNELDDEPSNEDKAAGIERLAEFGYSVTLHQLSKGVITEEEKILEYAYSKIFKKRCLLNTLSDINKQKQENASRKNQRNRR